MNYDKLNFIGSTKFYIITTIIGFVIFIVASYIIYTNYEKQYEIVTYKTEVNDVIYRIDVGGGISHIELKNGRKIEVLDIYNFKYSSSYFCHLVSQGDSISKEKNNDSLYLYKNDSIYVFSISND